VDPVGAGGVTGSQINADFSKYLGRDLTGGADSAAAWNAFSGMSADQAAQAIQDSPEGKAYAAAHAPAATTQPGAMASMPNIAGLQNSPEAQKLFQTLMGKATASPDVDPNDPIIKAQTEAYGANATRGARDFMTMAAERGGPYQSQDAAERSALEKAAQSTAGFGAQLMSDERAARRQDIQQALGMGSQFLTAQQSQALQEELDKLNLQERGYEFDTNAAYNQSPFAPGAVV
jgi:hypothetical protein